MPNTTNRGQEIKNHKDGRKGRPSEAIGDSLTCNNFSRDHRSIRSGSAIRDPRGIFFFFLFFEGSTAARRRHSFCVHRFCEPRPPFSREMTLAQPFLLTSREAIRVRSMNPKIHGFFYFLRVFFFGVRCGEKRAGGWQNPWI